MHSSLCVYIYLFRDIFCHFLHFCLFCLFPNCFKSLCCYIIIIDLSLYIEFYIFLITSTVSLSLWLFDSCSRFYFIFLFSAKVQKLIFLHNYFMIACILICIEVFSFSCRFPYFTCTFLWRNKPFYSFYIDPQESNRFNRVILIWYLFISLVLRT